MTDEEIRSALDGFSALWKRVNKKYLPEGLVLMPEKNGKISPYLR